MENQLLWNQSVYCCTQMIKNTHACRVESSATPPDSKNMFCQQYTEPWHTLTQPQHIIIMFNVKSGQYPHTQYMYSFLL